MISSALPQHFQRALIFNSIGDGNCLYYSEAAWLVYAFENKLLTPLYENPYFRNTLKALIATVAHAPMDPNGQVRMDLLGHVKQVEGGLQLKDQLLEGWSLFAPELAKGLERGSDIKAFGHLIHLLAPRKQGQVDYAMAQDILGPALRHLVAESIWNHPIVSKLVEKELTPILENAIAFSVELGQIQTAGYFDGMPEIEQKMIELIFNDELNPEQKQAALVNWFFKGKQEGLEAYLFGQKGIAQNGSYGGKLEQQVLSVLFQHVIQYNTSRTPGIIQTLNGFTNTAPKQGELTFTFQQSMGKQEAGDHWMVLLPFNNPSAKVIFNYMFQKRMYQERQDAIDQSLILGSHKTYEAHRKTFDIEISVKEYCGLYGLTEEIYTKNLLGPIPTRNAKFFQTEKEKKDMYAFLLGYKRQEKIFALDAQKAKAGSPLLPQASKAMTDSSPSRSPKSASASKAKADGLQKMEVESTPAPVPSSKGVALAKKPGA